MTTQSWKRVGILRQGRWQRRSRVGRGVRVERGGIDGVATGLRLSNREIFGLLFVRRGRREGGFLILESFFQSIDALEEGLQDVCFRAALFWNCVWRE